MKALMASTGGDKKEKKAKAPALPKLKAPAPVPGA
jgi:hypothetical protein